MTSKTCLNHEATQRTETNIRVLFAEIRRIANPREREQALALAQAQMSAAWREHFRKVNEEK